MVEVSIKIGNKKYSMIDDSLNENSENFLTKEDINELYKECLKGMGFIVEDDEDCTYECNFNSIRDEDDLK